MRHVLIILAILALQSCSFKVKNCELEPGADIESFQKDKPIRDQVNPKANVKCDF